jgi:thiamine-phosphate pyrophosphorylase
MSVPTRSQVLGEPRLFGRGVHVSRGLYAIVDLTQLARHGLDPVAFAQAVLVARPAALQVRAKEVAARELLGVLRAIGAMCRVAGVPMVANDRVDLAVLAGCDYVHVGQDDLSAERVHRVAPGLGVGVSTHTPEQLAEALLAQADYVAYGPVFSTPSKVDAEPCVGLDGLAHASARAREAGTTLVAIGGVTLERAPELRKWADASAAIHALLPSSKEGGYAEVTARAIALHAALGGDSTEPSVAPA